MQPSAATVETDDDVFGPPDPPVVTIAVEAPYGINPDTGKPYTMSPEARAAAGARMAAGRTAKAVAGGSRRTRAAKAARHAAGPPPLTKPPGSSSSKSKGKTAKKSQAEALADLTDAVGWGLATFGKRFRNNALIADGMAIGMHGGPLAEAVAEWAADNPHVERALGFLERTSPYTKIVAAAAPLLAQLAANHRMIPPGLMGAQDPEALATRFLENTRDVDPAPDTAG